MTYRTLDTDHTYIEPSAPVRHLRRRRRSLALAHRSGGVHFTGLGI
ncbi:MAG: hypothetical protein V3U57_08340 [Robiginitomaculum sp.]